MNVNEPRLKGQIPGLNDLLGFFSLPLSNRDNRICRNPDVPVISGVSDPVDDYPVFDQNMKI